MTKTRKTSKRRAKTKTKPITKIASVIALLERKSGATLVELSDSTGWQSHSIRAALAGLKKKGHVIVRTKRGTETCYRIGGAV